MIRRKINHLTGFLIALTLALTLASCRYTTKSKLYQKNKQTQPDTIARKLETQDELIVTALEQWPEFPGGASAMYKFIDSHLSYPTNLPRLTGKVFATFLVNTDGSIQDVTIVRSLRQDYDEAAIRLIISMPKWSPGRQSGLNVRVKYALPIKFK